MGEGLPESGRLVVIGNGMACVYTVEEVLKIRQDLSITIFGEERHVAYNRILLSEVLAGKRSPEGISLRTREWYEQNRIDLRLGVRVTAIDPARRSVTDSTGDVTPYDRLLIAVGGVPFIPPIKGTEKEGVFVFRNIEDTHRIMALARVTKQAVVIGGGLLGLEAARGLITHGVSVTVVHIMDRLMELQLDPMGAALLKQQIEGMGISVMLESSVEEILGEGKVEGVRLATGQVLHAGMALICTGIRPDTELARSAGLETRRGIVVNDQMETSHPDIYAVGDAIEHRGKTYGLVAPLRDQARVAADAMTGGRRLRYEGTSCATILKVSGVNLTSAGHFLGGDGDDEIVYTDTKASLYKKLVLRGNRLVGMILLGDNREGPRLFSLIQTGEDISAIKDRLLSFTSAEADASLSPVAAMADTELVCNCNSVTKGTIVAAICEKGLKTREEVAASTKASTGCGSCAQLVEDLLLEVRQKKPVAPPPATPVVTPSPSVESLLAGKPPLGYPVAYPKALEVERIKQEGLDLDFDLIRKKGVMALSEDDYYRLKTYGVCSQKHPGYFMLRIRIPGGRLTARQLRGLSSLAETYGRGWGHLTTRQDLELHWVRVEEVPEIWEKLEEIGLSTRSACGHTMRNVVACPHSGICPNSLIDVQPWAQAITDYFLLRSDLINPAMPNRLNIYFAGCSGCAPHAQINDIGFIAVKRPGSDGEHSEIGFELWAGGSLGSHPVLGFRLKEFISLEDTLAACRAIFSIHTKYGNRNKARSRLKFLVEQWGGKKFTSVFEKVFGAKRTERENRKLCLPTSRDGEEIPIALRRVRARLLTRPGDLLPPGCFPQRQPGYCRVVVDVPLGEIRTSQLQALARISERYGNGEVHLTTDQAVELHWVETRRLGTIARAVERAGLSLKGRKNTPTLSACPGTEFCVLALTNSQGAAREILAQVSSTDPEKAELLKGLTLHISGCPNSCARHQVADIGLAGAMAQVGEEQRFSYLLFLGGRVEGGIKLGEVVRKGITEESVVPTINALLDIVLEHRCPGEPFQQVIDRLGKDQIAGMLDARLSPTSSQICEKITMVPQEAMVP